MQAEILADNPASRIRILGLNDYSSVAGNADMCLGRVLPWLQDTLATLVWNSWGVTSRDTVILDDNNSVFSVYNLTVHDLSVPANYAELKSLLLQAAGE